MAYNKEGPLLQSEFNSSIAFLYRLDGIFRYCREVQLHGNYHKWFQALMGLWMEVSSETPTKHYGKVQKRIDKINGLIGQGLKKNKHGATTSFKASPDLIKNLFSFEMLLRKIIKERGLGVKDQADPGAAILQDG